jgi:hypothetical protein
MTKSRIAASSALLGMAVVAAAAAAFPREVVIVNDTTAQYVVGNLHIGPHSSVTKVVNDADEIVRLESDCEALMSLVPVYGDLATPPLRILDGEEVAVDADPAADPAAADAAAVDGAA